MRAKDLDQTIRLLPPSPLVTWFATHLTGSRSMGYGNFYHDAAATAPSRAPSRDNGGPVDLRVR